MRRANIATLSNNADAAALEVTRAALTNASGQAVLAGGQVSFTIVAASNEAFAALGNMVGFAYVPTTVDKSGMATAWAWHRWSGGDFTVTEGAPLVFVGPKDVPPGAQRVIALPLAVTDSGGSTTFSCGTFFHAPSIIG